MINPDWLRYFVTVSETLNYAEAAKHLHVTPQAVSKAITSLEQQLKVTLFYRDRRITGLTGPGEALQQEARAILGRMSEIGKRIIQSSATTSRKPIRIACNPLWSHEVQASLIAELAGVPDHRVQSHITSDEQVEAMVATGRADIGLLTGPAAGTTVTTVWTGRCPIVTAGRPTSPNQRIRWRGWDVDLPAAADVWAEVDDWSTAIRLCEQGYGRLSAPGLCLGQHLRTGILAILTETADGPSIPIVLIRHPSNETVSIASAAQTILQHLLAETRSRQVT